jgi:hypothetical protein
MKSQGPPQIPVADLSRLLPCVSLQFLDFDRGCILSLHEFMAGVQALRAWSVQPQQAKQYTSQKQMVADKKQHRRVEWNAQQALQEPITAAQTVSVSQVLKQSIDIVSYLLIES